jgi:hypothetical protein
MPACSPRPARFDKRRATGLEGPVLHVTLLDAIGLLGVLAMLVAYALTVARRLDPLAPPALLMNLAGSLAVLASLTRAFNLSAFVIEAAWALIAAAGLARWWWGCR